MSNTDSFIEEVTEEVRRDQLYKALKRYGWVVAAVLVLIVAAVGWSEWRAAQERAAAQAVGDGILDALAVEEGAPRLDALQGVEAGSAEAQAVVAFLLSAEQANAGDTDAAAQTMQGVTNSGDLPLIYRQIAQFKALGYLAGSADSAETRRAGYEALAQAGNPLRLLAQEQLALMDVAAGDTEAAIAGFQAILDDAEATAGLQERAVQVIVALGGEPDTTALQAPALGN